MKILPAIFFVAVGIWLTYTHPDIAKQAYSYILVAIDWVLAAINDFRGS